MRIYSYSIVAVLLLASHQTEAVTYFKVEQSKEHAADIDINLYDDIKHIGFVSYSKFFLLPIYIVHNLYVYPQYRKKGYGKKLLLYVCAFIKKLGAKVAYIQPGPFEIVNGHTVGLDGQHVQEMQKLVVFYEKYGFKRVDSVTSLVATLFYKVMKIHEDARYLMVKWF